VSIIYRRSCASRRQKSYNMRFHRIAPLDRFEILLRLQ